jgi:hypothetical protein
VQNVSQSADEEYMIESHNHRRAMSYFFHEIGPFFTLLYRKSDRLAHLNSYTLAQAKKKPLLLTWFQYFFIEYDILDHHGTITRSTSFLRTLPENGGLPRDTRPRKPR